jgi:hypothetical protein
VDQTDIRSRSTNDPLLNTAIGTLPADHLIPWEREIAVLLDEPEILDTRRIYLFASNPQGIYQTHQSRKYPQISPVFGLR